MEFAEKANEVGAYMEARSAALAELSMQGKDTMEEQLEAVKAFQAETVGYQPKLDEVEYSNQVSWCFLNSCLASMFWHTVVSKL